MQFQVVAHNRHQQDLKKGFKAKIVNDIENDTRYAKKYYIETF